MSHTHSQPKCMGHECAHTQHRTQGSDSAPCSHLTPPAPKHIETQPRYHRHAPSPPPAHNRGVTDTPPTHRETHPRYHRHTDTNTHTSCFEHPPPHDHQALKTPVLPRSVAWSAPTEPHWFLSCFPGFTLRVCPFVPIGCGWLSVPPLAYHLGYFHSIPVDGSAISQNTQVFLKRVVSAPPGSLPSLDSRNYSQ